MNDITSGGGAASAPSPSSTPAPSSSPAPSTPPTPSSQEALDTLATPEDASAYAEQRQADAGQTEREASEPQRRLSRYERLKKARDLAQAEAATLRAQSTGPRSADNTPESLEQWRDETQAANAGDQAAADGQQAAPPGYTPEEQAAAHQQLGEQMAREIETRALYREREKQLAAHVGHDHFRQVMSNVDDVALPPHVCDLIRASPHGPEISYHLAASVDGLELLMQLREASPLEAAKFIAKSAAIIDMRQQQQRAAPPPQRQQPRTVTQARPPIVPLRGSAGPSPDLRQLANSDNIDNYARHRMQQMRNKR